MDYNAEAAIRRADQVYFEFVCTRQTFDNGIAFTAERFPDSTEHNAFREVLIPQTEMVPALWDQVQQHYAEAGLKCTAWVPSAEQSVAVIEPFLLEKGLVKQTYAAMQIESWPDLAPSDNVRVLPGRAMRQALHAIFPVQEAAPIEAHMDYAQYDLSVATVNGRAAGCGGLLQAGEIGMIRDLYVVPGARRERIGTTLLSELLEMARRLMMRIVVMKVDLNDPGAVAFARHGGFGQSDQIIEFHVAGK